MYKQAKESIVREYKLEGYFCDFIRNKKYCEILKIMV